MNRLRIPRLILSIAFVSCFSAGAVLAMIKADKVTLKLAALGSWAAGTNQRCSWDWGNLDGNVEVTLWKANRLVVTLVPSCALGANGTGSVVVGVPAKIVPGTYEIRVKSISHPEIVARQAVTIVANPQNRSLPFDDGPRTGSGAQG
jgi:hypothetical protein